MTRATAEAVLVKRCGPALAAVGLDGTTKTGANADLNDPLAQALLKLGYAVTDLTTVADADLAGVGSDDYLEFFALAELAALENARASAVGLVDVSVGPRRESLSQMAGALEKLIATKRASYAAEFGAAGELDAGSFTVASQEDGVEPLW